MAEKQTTAYRIVAPHWVSTALTGEGAWKFGGRWNSPGRPVVYLGEARSLCALEMLVHLTTPGSRTKTYKLIEITLPEKLIATYPAKILPDGWRKEPPGKISMEIGDDWLLAGGHLALRVPSSVIPEAYNLLLNPLHKDFPKIIASEPSDFSFDKRL